MYLHYVGLAHANCRAGSGTNDHQNSVECIMPRPILIAVLAAGLAALAPSAEARLNSGGGESNSGYTTSLACLTAPARAIFNRIQSVFGPMEVISTCRPGARVAGTGNLSRHSSGNAIDFIAGGQKAAVVNWLIANHTGGGTMTYSNAPHIHVDIGPRWVILAGRNISPGGHGTAAARVAKHQRKHAPVQVAQIAKPHRKHATTQDVALVVKHQRKRMIAHLKATPADAAVPADAAAFNPQ